MSFEKEDSDIQAKINDDYKEQKDDVEQRDADIDSVGKKLQDKLQHIPVTESASVVPETSVSEAKVLQSRLFNRQRSVHDILGSGIVADIILWRRKNLSIATIAIASTVWFLFEKCGYTFLSLVANVLMLLIIILFLWSNAAAILHRPPPPLPNIEIREDMIQNVNYYLYTRTNYILKMSRELALGKDPRLFLKVAVILWLFGTVGAWFDMLTIVYLGLVFALTVPAVYERYEDHIDRGVYHASGQIKKYYDKFSKFVSVKMPKGTSKSKKIQ